MPDVFQNIDTLPADRIFTVAERLEFRGRDTQFVQMRSEYFDALALPTDARILELGAGTGVVSRGYATRKGFRGTCVVTDLSQNLLDYGRAQAEQEGLADRIDFRVADAITGSDLPSQDFDAVILHTLVSHVHDPEGVLSTAERCAKAGGQVAVFDADHDSLQVVSGEAALDEKANRAIKSTILANATVMRELPRVAPRLGLRLKSSRAHLLQRSVRASSSLASPALTRESSSLRVR